MMKNEGVTGAGVTFKIWLGILEGAFMTRIRFIAFLSLAGWLVASGPARADGGAEAKTLFALRDGQASPGALSAALRERLHKSLERGDDEGKGTGGRVWGLLVVQTMYDDEDGRNEFWLTWSNDLSNPSGLEIRANGVPVEDDVTHNPVVYSGLTTEATVYGVGDVGVGLITFTVVSEDSVAEDSIVGLKSQPFGDPDPLTCKDGPRDPTTLACSLILDIKTSRQPQFYYVTFDGVDLADTIPGVPSYTFPNVKKGTHTVGLLGAISEAGNDYLGDRVETSCDILCLDLPCDRPYGLDWCQNAFGPAAADNKVHLTWVNGEVSYQEIHATVDASPPVTLPGDATETTLENLAPGDHTVAIEGDCGANGKSDVASLPFTVLGAPPQPNPLKDLACRFPTPSGETLVATWKNLTDASYIEVYIVNVADEQRLDRTLSGQATSVAVTGTSVTDRIALRFLYSGKGSCYSSPLQVCTPTPPPGWKYLLGDCDGNSNFDITDAIFSLNHLFRGGNESPCAPGCDSNSDSVFNLADAIYSLNHLFRGGPTPAGRYPQCDETAPGEPTCSQTTCNR